MIRFINEREIWRALLLSIDIIFDNFISTSRFLKFTSKNLLLTPSSRVANPYFFSLVTTTLFFIFVLALSILHMHFCGFISNRLSKKKSQYFRISKNAGKCKKNTAGKFAEFLNRDTQDSKTCLRRVPNTVSVEQSGTIYVQQNFNNRLNCV